jgi:signal peptidase II
MTMKKLLRVLVIVFTVLANIGCDQLTKAIAQPGLKGKPPVSLLGGILVLRYAENEGTFLGLGSDLPHPMRTVFTIGLPILIIAGMIVFLARKKEMDALLVLGASCILGGGAGNLMDRIRYHGRVSDFLNLGIGSFRVTGIFNMADMSILLGCLFFFIFEIARWKAEKKARPENPEKE